MSDNIVKKVCKELGITQKELAERLGVPQPTVSRWEKGDIPRMAELAFKLLLENISLHKDLDTLKKAHQILHNERGTNISLSFLSKNENK